MAGNWARTEGCKTGNFLAWSATNSAQANANYTKYHLGIGTGVYWYMGGPGVDPHWNGTTAEAYQVGRRPGGGRARGDEEAQRHLPGGVGRHRAAGDRAGPRQRLEQRLLLALQRASRCSSSVPATVDRAEFNGFANYITSHSTYKVGVYSSAPVWNSIFGTGSAGSIPNTYEWTYLPETKTVDFSTQPTGWCLHDSKTCAQFFGGQSSSSKYALMWQWSGGGGITNKYGFDFDQIDIARMK